MSSRSDADAEVGAESEAGAGTEAGTGGEEQFTGSGLNRVEDRRILTGEAEFVHDKAPQDALHMALVRSMHPHAEIADIDASEAEDHPGCHLVLTAEDLKDEYNPMPAGLPGFEEWSLADGKARYVGEPVVAVVADDRYVAEDVVDLVDVTYDKLDAVVDPREAREDEVVVHEEFGTNVGDNEELTFGDPDAAFEAADHVVAESYSWGRISGVPLETAGVVADYDADSDSFDIDCNIQLHTLVDDTVYDTLGYDPEDVHLDVPPDVGGSFGTKIAIHRYCCLAAMASKELERPVSFVEDRIENLQGGDMHSTEREYDVKLAVDDDGTIQGMDFWFVDDFGAWPRYPVNQVLKPLSVLSNAYDVQNARYEYDLVLTNKTCQTAYRGFGVPAHLYALEMIVDQAAEELGMDPDVLRRRNLIESDQMPYELPSKNIYDSGDFPAAMAHVQAKIDDERDGGLLDSEVVAAKREQGKYRGVRPTVHIEPGVSGSDWTDRQRSDREELPDRDRDDVAELPEHLRAEIREDGTVRAHLATDSSGQGHQTLVTQLLADELGILPSDVDVSYLDSAEAPTEYGSAASRMAVMVSGAAQGLGDRLVGNLETLAAAVWDCPEADVTYRDGEVARVDGDARLSLGELAAEDAKRDVDGDERLTRASYDYEHPATQLEDFDEALTRKFPVYPTAAFAANAPIVEVDVNTGEVEILKLYSLRDCGTQLNPTIVEGQAHGGLAQGIGAALQEEFGYDATGQPQAITLFDYRLPSIENIPEMELDHTETPSPFTATGAKGTGEGGMIDGPASIACSINDALEPLDVKADQIPFTPNRVRERVRKREE
jgi:carbon-monoxide dehydrogenase large subunit